MAKVTKFYDSYERVVTPTSKSVVLEYKGESAANFTFNVDISGKNANNYSLGYENIPTRSGDDLVITTVFISNSGSAKTVTTTVKNYFASDLLEKIEIKNTLYGTKTIYVDQNTDLGKKGLYAQVNDGPYDDYILAPDYKTEIHFADKGYDHIYDVKGDDAYYANGGKSEYFLDLAGNDAYNSSNGNLTIVYDIKGNDKYLSNNSDTKISTRDFNGNDEYKVLDSAALHAIDYKGNDKYIVEDFGYLSLVQDIKGNDEYYLGSHTASNIKDEAGNDEYEFINAWVTTGANIIEDRYGNDEYEIIKSIGVNITDYSGNDEYEIKNIDTSLEDFANPNFTILDYTGNDKYELENITSDEGQGRSYITEEAGNDSYFATNVNYVSFYDEMGNDKYNFIAGKYVTIYDYLGKDTYTLKGTESENLSNLTINDMETNKKSASDKYILEKTNRVGITDNAGNDNYNIKESEYCTIEDYTGNDKYDLLDSEVIGIIDGAGNDKYNLQYLNSGSISAYNRIKDEAGNDSYSIANSWDVEFSDNLGKDKYTFVGENHNIFMSDDNGADSYISKGKNYLSCTYIDDYGTESDTYTLNGWVTGSITDEGGNNKFGITNSSELSFYTIGIGNDQYNFKNISDFSIQDNSGDDKYILSDANNGDVIERSGADTYTNSSKSKLTCVSLDDQGAGNDTYKFYNYEGTIKDDGGNNTFTINNGQDVYITASGTGNDKYSLKNLSSWYAKDTAGDDKYTVENCSYGSITDNEGNDNYSIAKNKDMIICDYSGDDKYSININGIKNGRYYIEDCGSGTDSLTISGLNAKNVVYLTDFDENEKNTGDLIILDKSSKNYIQIDHFFNYNDSNGYIFDEFDEGCIETIKAGKTTLNIDEISMSAHLNIISASIASWLTLGAEYDSVIDVLNSGDDNAINELIAYCQG